MTHNAELVIVTAVEVITVVYGFYGLMQWKMNYNHKPKVQKENKTMFV